MSEKIKVFKRDIHPELASALNGFSKDRPWIVGATTYEDKRRTCYKTWEDAMRWATMPPMNRAFYLAIEESMEPGW